MRRRSARHRERKKILAPFWDKIKRNKKKIFLLFICLSIAFLIFYSPRLIKIHKIRCTSQYGPCSPLLEENLQNIQGNNYPNAKNEIKKLLSKEAFVKSYSYKLLLPNQIDLVVVERKAIAALMKEENREEFFTIDEEGYILSTVKMTNLPLVILKTSFTPQVSGQANSEVLFAVKLLVDLQKTYSVKFGYLESDRFNVELPNKMTAIFPLAGDPDVLFGSLALILSRLNTEQMSSRIERGNFVPKSIDLRFKNPILK